MIFRKIPEPKLGDFLPLSEVFSVFLVSLILLLVLVVLLILLLILLVVLLIVLLVVLLILLIVFHGKALSLLLISACRLNTSGSFELSVLFYYATLCASYLLTKKFPDVTIIYN